MNGSSYRFSDFRIDIGARELWRGPKLLTVSPKVFDCIAYLIENRERAVGRDELIAAVWGRADIADVQLSYLMRKIRRTLGDSGEGKNLIRTIPRFGFRWLADVSNELPTDADTHTAPAGAPPVATASRPADAHRLTRRTRWWTIAWVSLVVALASMASVYLWHHRPPASDATTRINSVATEMRSSVAVFAVLPVTGDIGGDSDWMRLGLMDSIAGRLRSAALVVAPSADIVVLTRNETTSNDLVGRTRTAIGAREVVVPTALRDERGWTVRLELHSADGHQREVEAQAPDAILAAREAADRLLDLLGVAPPDGLVASLSAEELLQRIEAALLATDYVRARQLIETAPVELRELQEVQLQWGRIEVAAGHPELARPRFARLLGNVSAEENTVLRARVLIGLGVADLDQPATAVQHFSESIRLLEQLNEPGFLGDAYNGRGLAKYIVGDFDAAYTDYARARIAFALAKDSGGLARVDNNEAAMDSRLGRPASALPLLIRTAERFERIGALDLLVSPLVNVISTYLELLQPTDALGTFRQAETRFDHIENSRNLYIWKITGAVTLAANGQLEEARALLDEVAEAADRATAPLALTYSATADLEFSAGRYNAAMTAGRRAVESLSVPHRLVDERAKAWLVLIRALDGLGRNAEARNELERFVTWSHGETERGVELRVLIAEAEHAMRNEHPDVAMTKYDQALHSAQRNGSPAELAIVAVSFGNALIDVGDLGRASTVSGRIGRWVERDFSCALLQLRLYHALGQHEAWRSALGNARALAGERRIPTALTSPPSNLDAEHSSL